MGGMFLCTKRTCLTGSWNGRDVPVHQVYMFNRVMGWVGGHVYQVYVYMFNRVMECVGCPCVAGS